MHDCFAYYEEENGRIHIGNARIEKVLHRKGSYIRTERVIDRKNGKVWEGGAPLWQRCPVLGAEEAPAFCLRVHECTAPVGMQPHLQAILTWSGTEGTVNHIYTVFPDIPFVYCQITARKEGEFSFENGQTETLSCTGIEVQMMTSADGEVFCSTDTLECIPLCAPHLVVESALLYDKTDRNDALVERQTVPLYKNGRCEREGNLFQINDYPNGDSLLLVKHAPTPSSALNRTGKDLVVQGTAYATLMGTGMDFSAMPAGDVPYYASAIGVAKTEEISEEFWRYSTALSTGDAREALFVMSNTWGDRSQDMAICESFILQELERAKELGVDILQIDDGWQKGITANSLRKKGGVWEGYYRDDNDFWEVNAERFPNGLTPILERAQAYGVELGLWFSPDSSDDFANVERDIETLYHLYKTLHIRYFKLDGVKIRNKRSEMRFVHMLDELNRRTKGDLRFNLDVTAEDRFGYLYHTEYGTLFVENRYTDFLSYYPHNTSKNLWNLASVVPTRRLQMELLNVCRNADKYKNDPFAPSLYGMDYLFASVMVANPLLWMEMSHLPEDEAQRLARISAVYKYYKNELFHARVIPVGDEPNGMHFFGYVCRTADRQAEHLLLFREATACDTYTFSLPLDGQGTDYEILYQSAPASVAIVDGGVRVQMPEKRSFVWMAYHTND